MLQKILSLVTTNDHKWYAFFFLQPAYVLVFTTSKGPAFSRLVWYHFVSAIEKNYYLAFLGLIFFSFKWSKHHLM
jgi:hypothetical protein